MYFLFANNEYYKNDLLEQMQKSDKKNLFCEEKFDIIEVREKVLCISSKGIE